MQLYGKYVPLLLLQKFFQIGQILTLLKFIYSEKVTKFCEIFPFLLTVCTVVKSKRKISQNFVTFSEYMNFILGNCSLCDFTYSCTNKHTIFTFLFCFQSEMQKTFKGRGMVSWRINYLFLLQGWKFDLFHKFYFYFGQLFIKWFHIFTNLLKVRQFQNEFI